MELKKAELTQIEISLLIDYYEQAIRETERCQSPIVANQREGNIARRDQIARYLDGRVWNGRRKSRKPAIINEPTPQEEREETQNELSGIPSATEETTLEPSTRGSSGPNNGGHLRFGGQAPVGSGPDTRHLPASGAAD